MTIKKLSGLDLVQLRKVCEAIQDRITDEDNPKSKVKLEKRLHAVAAYAQKRFPQAPSSWEISGNFYYAKNDLRAVPFFEKVIKLARNGFTKDWTTSRLILLYENHGLKRKAKVQKEQMIFGDDKKIMKIIKELVDV
jgi:uncharacterized protein YxjI